VRGHISLTHHLYLSGPMRGIAEFNFPAFKEAATRLRLHGHKVLSPAEKDEQVGFVTDGMTGNEDLAALGFDLHAALAWDCAAIATPDCIGVVCLEGWQRSSGCRAEVALALALGKPVWEYWLRGAFGSMSEQITWHLELVKVDVTMEASSVPAAV
jgi:nucleoside 2-deoxyribosyltransferase